MHFAIASVESHKPIATEGPHVPSNSCSTCPDHVLTLAQPQQFPGKSIHHDTEPQRILESTSQPADHVSDNGSVNDATTELQTLHNQVVTLQSQLQDVTSRKIQLEQQLQEEKQWASAVVPKYPADGRITQVDWDKLHLKLRKAERALEQERTQVEVMRQKLESQQHAAAIGTQAAATIHRLETELAACKAVVTQRTCEAEALQRAVHLNDETVARLRAQLSGLLDANQAALAKEHDMERQISELRRQVEQHQTHAAHANDALAVAHQQAQVRIAQLEQENQRLRGALTQQGEALTASRAECARREAGIRALEAVLSQHGRQPLPGPADTTITARQLPQPSVGTADVAIEIGKAPAQLQSGTLDSTPAETPLANGLTESQWKLVMLSEEVRALRLTVQQLRRQSLSADPQVLSCTRVQLPAYQGKGHNSTEEVEVLEVDLPPEEVQARVDALAKQMHLLEEEMQSLLQTRGVNGVLAQPKTEAVITDRPPQEEVTAGQQGGALSGGHQPGQQGAPEQPEQSQGVGVVVHSVPLVSQADRRKGRRRGWWSWLVGARANDSSGEGVCPSVARV